MTSQQPKLKKWQIFALGGIIAGLAILITVGTIREKASEQAAQPTNAPVASETPKPEQVLTIHNSKDFAALLTGPDNDWDVFKAFAAKYQGRTIEFDGNVASRRDHGDFRYDFLILTGNYGESPRTGPNFKFSGVNVRDLHLTGPTIPEVVGAGDNVHVIAKLDDYNRVQGLFLLDPISTEIR
ncbi:DUF4839 domain-containing protein [Catelliglobosispora koreensis]|uniref:DUF4839 domain-containing protein n=1 Tax=Catelliglobosispora koreensis TaxID=129052 RepID=UPI00037E3BF0|nr:DUF4839 domain-containing protein [Catelliglobosispora koreensis]